MSKSNSTKHPVVQAMIYAALLLLGAVAIYAVRCVMQYRNAQTLGLMGATVAMDPRGVWLPIRATVPGTYTSKITGVSFSPNRAEMQIEEFSETNSISDGSMPQAMQAISGLHTLTLLDLEATNITDQGGQHLSLAQDVEVLDLSDTLVGDATLQVCVKMSGLTTLDITSTQVTPAGIAQFEQLRPDVQLVKIDWPPQHRMLTTGIISKWEH